MSASGGLSIKETFRLGKAATQYGGITIVFLVLLRLATGWHFYNEGVKKFEPGFSSAGFLLAAKGPFAEQFHKYVPGPHDANSLLSSARDQTAHHDDQASSEWLARIEQDWQSTRNEVVAALGNDPGIAKQADTGLEESVDALRTYLAEEETAISDYRHELWRISELKKGYQQGTLPYQDERIADKERETLAKPRKWIAGVAFLEKEYLESLEALATDDQRSDHETAERLAEAMYPQTELARIDLIVTWVVTLVGLCLMLGLLTRLAAVVGAGFLLSVLASQPPWVYGADTAYCFYQVVEVAGLLLLAAVGAGRWFGVDGLLFFPCRFCCRRKSA